MTTCETLIETYLSKVESELLCTPLEDGQRMLLDTPYLHPDGDVIQVVIEPLPGSLVRFGDEGATLARLRMYGVDVGKGSSAREARASLRAYRAELVGDELRVEGRAEEMPEMLLRLIGAMRAIDGLSALRTDPGPVQFASRLTTFLQSQFGDVNERPERRGMSGSSYRLTAAVPRRGEEVLIQSAAGGNADTARRSVEHAFRVFSDINGQVPIHQKLVVLSSGEGWPWPAEEVKLLSRVAYVGGWDERDRVAEFLRGDVLPKEPIMVSWQTAIE
jgi:hypothetical protein